ncbi:MAG TPA: hypothetical protein VGF86_02575 [Candidatus Tumulicola sp.]
MPFLAATHLRAARCPDCGDLLADAGARSFVVHDDGRPVFFDPGDPAAEMIVRLACREGHAVELLIPNELSAEEVAAVPEQAPLGVDAVLLAGKTESGAAL